MSISRGGRSRPLLGVVLAVAAVTPMLGACGGSSSSSRASAPTSTAPAAAAGPSAATATTTAAASTTATATAAAASASSAPAANGPDCGQIATDSNGFAIRLFITSGTVSCAEAKKAWTDYGSAAKEGSGGFATVDGGWQCGHGSAADVQQSNLAGGCQNGPKSFETRVSSAGDASGGPSTPATGGSAPSGCGAAPKKQQSGTDLAAILACISSFPTGNSATIHTNDSGLELVPQPTDPGQLYRAATCVYNATLPDYSVLGTAYARREYAVTSAFSATIDQFQDNATASAFLADRRDYVQRCAASRFPGSAWQATSVSGLPATLFTMPGLREVIVIDGTELIDVSANTPAGQSLATSTPPEKVAADIVAAFPR